MKRMSNALQPGEINLGLIPVDWPLTPLGDKKNPYLAGWQNKPQTVSEISKEIEADTCKAVGLLSGPVYNEPYGLVWVDIDGPTVYKTIQEISGTSVEQALPKTLTILSGKEGRERKLYKVFKKDWDKFIRNKYAWHAEGTGEKLEILWKRHQGVLMGSHPDTDGYYTKPDEDFTFVNDLPEIPVWVLAGIGAKNAKQGIPEETQSRMFGENFAINTKIGHEHEIKEAIRALWSLPSEYADDYDTWLTAGQALHFVDETLVDEWDEWSKQSEKYKEGACHEKWRSFDKGGGLTVGSLYKEAQKHGFQFSQDHKVMPVSDDSIDALSDLLTSMLNNEPIMPDSLVETFANKKSFIPSGETLEDKSKRNAPADEILDILTQMYQGNLLFSSASNKFCLYEYEVSGLWSTLTQPQMKRDLWAKLKLLKNTVLPRGFGLKLVNDMYDGLSQVLQHDYWNQDKSLILFRNGVFDISTGELGGFKKEYYINRSLPYDYDPYATCEPIINWLYFTQHGDKERVQLLRAWLRAVLTSADDIQKFLEVVGPGKSGKSSFANLCHALVGFENATVSTLERIEKNRFETAEMVDKKLILFNDVERYGGNVTMLKALTGTDLISSEHKYRQTKTDFKFDGLIVITANEQVQSTDPSSGLHRRRLTVPFDRPFTGSSKEQTTLINCGPHGTTGIFTEHLPGLVNWLLKMSEDEMREYLMETSKKVPYFQKYNTRQQVRANPLIDWLNQNCIFFPMKGTFVGDCRPAPRESRYYYANTDKKLYANYCEFCRCNGGNAMSRSRFENMLLDILNHQLNINVYKLPNIRMVFLQNILLRESEQTRNLEDYPSIVELAQNPEQYRGLYGDVRIRYNESKVEESE